MATIADVIEQYGGAIGLNDMFIDKETICRDLKYLADEARMRGKSRINDGTAMAIRRSLGLCQYGGEHWDMYCIDDCEYGEYPLK